MRLPALFVGWLSASAAFAQDASPAAPSAFQGLFPIVLIIVIFYFLIIRPQNKKMKEHRAMIDAIQRGDKVVTAGGIHGKVTRVEDGGQLRVKIDDEVEVTVEQSTISRVISKPGADKGEKSGKDGASKQSRKNEPQSEAKGKSDKQPKAANDNR